MDVLLKILEQMKETIPNNRFINGLHDQYCNIGGLSKKQMEGLYIKAKESGIVSHAHLATLEAMTKKKVTRQKSEKVTKAPEYYKGQDILHAVEKILERFPQHKMALFLQTKIKNKQPVSDAEINEVNRLFKLLIK
jgi:hypothetical protein